MKIRAIMRQPVRTVRPDDHLSTAIQLMLWSGSRHLPVVEEERLVGMLSERDVLRYRAEYPAEAAGVAVRQAMSAPVHVVTAEDSVGVAAGRMVELAIGCLPVVDGDRLQGIVTARDLLRSVEAATAPTPRPRRRPAKRPARRAVARGHRPAPAAHT